MKSEVMDEAEFNERTTLDNYCLSALCTIAKISFCQSIDEN